MSNKNNVRMPSSGAGITSFADEMTSKFHFQPGAVVVFIVIMIVIVAAFHYFGSRILGV